MNGAQLPLAMRWPQQQRFDSYLVGENDVTLDALRRAAVGAGTDWVFLSGPTASGKTHLLIAACADANAHARRAQYVSLRAASTASRAATADGTRAIRALGGSDLLAIDDVDAIAGQREAEHALFDLYNRCKTEGATLVLAATLPPAQIGLVLPDLVSRLSICVQAALKPLDDARRREVVRARAEARGLILDDAALDWLFIHTQRDLASLADLVDRLDRASLAAQRRITLPFLREFILNESVGGGSGNG
ncbi:MAG: DnaA regulatory inactivator Hda [Rudaea sp.]